MYFLNVLIKSQSISITFKLKKLEINRGSLFSQRLLPGMNSVLIQFRIRRDVLTNLICSISEENESDLESNDSELMRRESLKIKPKNVNHKRINQRKYSMQQRPSDEFNTNLRITRTRSLSGPNEFLEDREYENSRKKAIKHCKVSPIF